MPANVQQLHVNRPLTDFSLAVVQDQRNFIALQAVPFIGVNKNVDLYSKYKTQDLHRREVRVRRQHGEADKANWTIDRTNTYNTERYALAHDIGPEDDAQADDEIDNDFDATFFLTLNMLMHLENDFMVKFCTASCGWATEVAGVASGPTGTQFLRWSDNASDPIENVRLWKRAYVQSKVGLEPRIMIVPKAVHDRLLDHPDIIARLDSGQTPGGPAVANAARLATIFDVDQYFVSAAIQDSANEGATANPGYIMGNNVLLMHQSPVISRRVPTAALRFAWKGLSNEFTGRGFSVKRYQLEDRFGGSRRVEVETAYEFKITAPELGVLATTVL